MRRDLLFKGALALVLIALGFFLGSSITAQHIDVFNIPREKAEKRVAQGPELSEVQITDTFTYVVLVEKDKLDKGNVFANELEVHELTADERTPYLWGQVEFYERKTIKQMQTRTTDFLKCFRTRTGTLFYLPDGKRVIDWGPWSFWDCR
jgi:hypothetical protein